MDNNDIRFRIRQARREAGLSQQQLADRLGVCRNTVINLESTNIIVNPLVFRLAEVLPISPFYVLCGEEFPKNTPKSLAALVARLSDEQFEVFLVSLKDFLKANGQTAQ